MKKTLCLLAALNAIVAVTSVATEYREHYSVANRVDKTPAFRVTTTEDPDEAFSVRRGLIADTRGPLLRVDIKRDRMDNYHTATFTLMRGSGASLTITETLPSPGTARPVPQEIGHSRIFRGSVPLSIQPSSGNELQGLDTDWRGVNGQANRERTRAAIDKELMNALDRLRELPVLPMLFDLNEFFVYIFDEPDVVSKSEKLIVTKVNPDCEFDASFGVPCPRLRAKP